MCAQRTEALDGQMVALGLPLPLSVKLRDFYRFMWQRSLVMEDHSMFLDVSAKLRMEVTRHARACMRAPLHARARTRRSRCSCTTTC